MPAPDPQYVPPSLSEMHEHIADAVQAIESEQASPTSAADTAAGLRARLKKEDAELAELMRGLTEAAARGEGVHDMALLCAVNALGLLMQHQLLELHELRLAVEKIAGHAR